MIRMVFSLPILGQVGIKIILPMLKKTDWNTHNRGGGYTKLGTTKTATQGGQRGSSQINFCGRLYICLQANKTQMNY